MFMEHESVTKLAEVWDNASQGLSQQGKRIRSCEMAAHTFGDDHTERMAGVAGAIVKIAGKMDSWQSYAEGYRDNLHRAVTAFKNVDEASTQNFNNVGPESGKPGVA